jgi:hypothetical protein
MFHPTYFLNGFSFYEIKNSAWWVKNRTKLIESGDEDSDFRGYPHRYGKTQYKSENARLYL